MRPGPGGLVHRSRSAGPFRPWPPVNRQTFPVCASFMVAKGRPVRREGGTVSMEGSSTDTTHSGESPRATLKMRPGGPSVVLRSLQTSEFDLCGATGSLNRETLP